MPEPVLVSNLYSVGHIPTPVSIELHVKVFLFTCIVAVKHISNSTLSHYCLIFPNTIIIVVTYLSFYL